MSWHYSLALEAEYSAENSLDGEQSALLSGMHTHGTCWLLGKTTDAFKPSLSGMTFRPLTADHGKALLMWCLEVSRAKTLAPLEKAPVLVESEAVCGSTWRELSVKYDPTTHSWKTHQCLWEEDLPSSSLTLPSWGMMLSGVLWERITPAHLTNETESGLLPNGVNSFHTPNTTGLDGWSNSRKALKKRQEIWPTPRAGNPGSRPNGKGGKILAEEVKKSVMWATPCAGDYRSPNLNPCKNGQKIEPASGHALPAQVGGQLNPTWVEWLMGWPLGWTDCAASATDKFRQWLNSHGKH